MSERPLGRTGLSTPPLGFGAAPLGNLYRVLPDTDSAEAVAAALDGGVRLFDTAPYYGFGLSERRLGDALRGRAAIVSTKVGRLLDPDPAVTDDRLRHGFRSPLPFAPRFDYGYDAVLRSHEASLQRLGRAAVDLLLVHDIGRLTHGAEHGRHMRDLVAGGIPALERLRDEGVIRGFGIGVNEVAVCHEVMAHARLDVILLAGRYTLLDQSALAELLPRCAAAGTAVVVGGPFNSGILATGVGGAGPFHYDYGEAPAAIVERVRQIEAVCARHDVPLRAAALQFPCAHPAVACVIPGLDAPDRVRDAVAMASWPIPAGFWAELKDERLIDRAAPVLC